MALLMKNAPTVLLLLALPCASTTSLPHGLGEKVVEFCVSSRWGFSCFDAASSRGLVARAGVAGLGKIAGRSALATMGLFVAREAVRDINELRRSKGVALQRLFDGPVVAPLTAAAAAAPVTAAAAAGAPAVEGSSAAAAEPTDTAAEGSSSSSDASASAAEPAEDTLGPHSEPAASARPGAAAAGAAGKTASSQAPVAAP